MIRCFVALIFAILSSSAAWSWDTKEVEHKEDHNAGWLSIYLCLNGGGACSKNEHELVSNQALGLATVNSPWLIGNRRTFETFDLNAELFRTDLRSIGLGANNHVRQPNPGGRYPLERRRLPPPPHFASIPDISYSIYDWANKNQLCPPLPQGHAGTRDCHVFTSWHGSRLNASHFGSQASMSYQRLHGTALSLADNAASMMQRALDIDKANGDTSYPTLTANKQAIQEAEYLALAYESAAQHFLGDRWAMGHMFDRWGAPTYIPGGYGTDEVNATLAGGLTGLIHGYESLTGNYIPDAMSSPAIIRRPWYIPNALYISQWRFDGDPTVNIGVGDYRLQDMKDGYFGKEYSAFQTFTDRHTVNFDRAMDVSVQRDWMFGCLAAGYGAVINRFAAHPDGGRGIDDVTVTSAGNKAIGPKCFSAWATNYAMNSGWGWEGIAATDQIAKTGLSLSARIAMKLAGDYAIRWITDPSAEGTRAEGITDGERISLVSTTARLASRAYWSPNETDMAKGGLGSFGAAKTSGNYPIASYLEPTSIDTMPDTAPNGRDKEAVYGLFNRAGAGYICQRTPDLLETLRKSAEPKDRAVCRVLAQRLYRGTWEEYSGVQAEHHTVEYEDDRREAAPLCEISGQLPSASRADDMPMDLHPGYVSWAPAGATGGIDRQDEWYLSNQSIANWCDGVPVVDLLEAEKDLVGDVAVRMEATDKTLELTGLNFGETEGTLLIGMNRSTAKPIADISKWTDTEISFRIEDQIDDLELGEIAFPNSEDIERGSYLFVETASARDFGTKSVGRFVLLDDLPRPVVASVKIERGSTVFVEYEAPDGEAEEDPGAFADAAPEPPEPGPFRPIDAGPIVVTVEFDMPMDREEEAVEFLLGRDILVGDWQSSTKWRGTMDLLGGDFFERRVGFQTLSVAAKSEAGVWLDADKSAEDDQPFTEVQALFDTIPIFVERISVRGGSSEIYAARWQGGPDMEAEPNLTAAVLEDPTRQLNVSKRVGPPADGEGEIRTWLSRESLDPPTGTVGGETIAFTGEGRAWRGSFDMAAAREAEVNGRTPIALNIKDESGRSLDGDPRSVTQINPPGSGKRWVRYEDKRGGGEASGGGTDDWHFLSLPVDLSMVLILDASGSMGEGTGRMENAKAGIEATLTTLPEDKVVEIGGVIFYSCTDLRTRAFTRDVDGLRSFFASAAPTSWTSLAKAHYVAGDLFDASADPASKEWRYATFTDGIEACDGDVASAARALDRKIANRTVPEDPDEREEPPALEPMEKVACSPASWRAYEVASEAASPTDTIRMVEHWYLERSLPDGRCFGRLETRSYGVYYGASDAVSSWGINSRPSETNSLFGSSSKSKADLDNVRNKANQAKSGTTDLAAARTEVETRVMVQLARE